MNATAMSAAGLNQAALTVAERAATRALELGIEHHTLPCGAHVLDFGVNTSGGLSAGQELARIALADRAEVAIVPGDCNIWRGPWAQVSSHRPVEACMFAQYAGWPVQHDKFFAMGSGPMRVKRGREEVLEHYQAEDPTALAVGTLECDRLPDCDIAGRMADECQVMPAELWLAIAPTRSLAGCVQVVARSVETSLHKLHEQGFNLTTIRSAFGVAPVPPPTPDFGQGIGRTNDAILYGGMVSLWVEAEDDAIAQVGPRLPSSSSCDFGLPFAEIFKRYEYDFYKVDPGLFSPAAILIQNLKTGRAWSFGQLRPDLVARSFGV